MGLLMTRSTTKVLTLFLLTIVTSLTYAAPASTQLEFETDGLLVTLNWASVEAAVGYKLYYAPDPYGGLRRLHQLSLGILRAYKDGYL